MQIVHVTTKHKYNKHNETPPNKGILIRSTVLYIRHTKKTNLANNLGEGIVLTGLD